MPVKGLGLLRSVAGIRAILRHGRWGREPVAFSSRTAHV
jgi:hypothetical protein